MPTQENIRLDEEFLAAWDTHDVDRAMSILSDDVVWHDVTSSKPMYGKSEVRPYIQSWFTAFPDMKSKAKNRVVTDDQVATEVEFIGTNNGPLQMGPGKPTIPATGKAVTGKGTYFMQIRDGKAVELHSYPDAAGMMMQLGLIPPPTE